MRAVSVLEACPIRRSIHMRLAPAVSRREAKVCRQSCMVWYVVMSADNNAFLKWHERAVLLIGLPFSINNLPPPSLSLCATMSRIAVCMGTIRFLPAAVLTPPLKIHSDRSISLEGMLFSSDILHPE